MAKFCLRIASVDSEMLGIIVPELLLVIRSQIFDAFQKHPKVNLDNWISLDDMDKLVHLACVDFDA